MLTSDIEFIKREILMLRNQYSETARYMEHFLNDVDDTNHPFDLLQNQNKYAAIKAETGIYQLDELSLQSWYLIKKLEITDLQILIPRLRTDCAANVAAITSNEHIIHQLEKSLADFPNPSEARNTIEQQLATLDADLQKCRAKLDRMKKLPFQLDEIIAKSEQLKEA